MKRIAVILDVSEEGWEQCRDSILAILASKGYVPILLKVFLGGRRSWKHFPDKQGVVYRDDFSRGRCISAPAEEFCKETVDALVCLPSVNGELPDYLVAHCSAALKVGRKDVGGRQYDVLVGGGPGEEMSQLSAFEAALSVLEQMFWV